MTERIVSQVAHLKPHFKVKALSLALTLLSAAMAMPAYALQEVSESDLSEATAEGVAFIPQNFRMILQGASAPNAAGSVTAASLADRTLDTGYIRLIPVGPLSATALASQTNTDYNNDGKICAAVGGTCTAANLDKINIGKADLYLYGLGISQSEVGVGVGRTSAQWNSRYNATPSGLIGSLGSYLNPWVLRVKTDSVPDFTGVIRQLPYLQMEAPLYTTSSPASLSAAEKAQYNLKLGFWADSLIRDPSKIEGDGAQFDLGGTGRANRLRLQGVWDGFSLNGTKLQLFQTLGGATNAGGLSTSYNNTLGLAGVIRLNSGDASNLKATVSTVNSVRSYSIPTGSVATGSGATLYGNTWNGTRFAAAGTAPNYTDTSGTNGGAASPACVATTATHRAAGSSCLVQYQTRVVSDSASSATWTAPALTSVFRLSTQETSDTALNATPGVNGGSAPTFSLDEGLFLYNLNVNLVVGSLAQPFTFGVAPDGRNIVLEVARIPNIQSVYRNIYTRYAGDVGDGGVTYTGSTCNVYQCGTSTIAGYQGNTATHSSISIGSTNYNATTNELTAYDGIESVGISFGALGSNTVTNAAQSYRDVQRATRTATTTAFNAFGAFANLPVGSSALFNSAATSPNTFTQQTPLTAPATPSVQSPLNNLGSAVIDGLLIQHLKFTTTGL